MDRWILVSRLIRWLLEVLRVGLGQQNTLKVAQVSLLPLTAICSCKERHARSRWALKLHVFGATLLHNDYFPQMMSPGVDQVGINWTRLPRNLRSWDVEMWLSSSLCSHSNRLIWYLSLSLSLHSLSFLHHFYSFQGKSNSSTRHTWFTWFHLNFHTFSWFLTSLTIELGSSHTLSHPVSPNWGVLGGTCS